MTQTKSSRIDSKEQLTELWYSRCGAATASALAIRKNWLPAEFSKGGTVLRSLRDSDDRAVLDSHYHHGLTGLFREGGNIPPIWARAAGGNTAVIGITWLDEYQGILTRADSGIRDVADLKGKRLALPRHDNLIDFQRGAALHGFVTALGLDRARAFGRSGSVRGARAGAVRAPASRHAAKELRDAPANSRDRLNTTKRDEGR